MSDLKLNIYIISTDSTVSAAAVLNLDIMFSDFTYTVKVDVLKGV